MMFPRPATYRLYSVLRGLCILHSLPVQSVSRKTLYNWSRSGVDPDSIDLLRLRLQVRGFLTPQGFLDLCDNLDISPPFPP